MLTVTRQQEIANGAQMTDEEREYVSLNGLSPRVCATEEMTTLYALMFASDKECKGECYMNWYKEFGRREHLSRKAMTRQMIEQNNCSNCIKPTQATHELDGSFLCSPCYRACVG